MIEANGRSTLFCQPKDLEREIWDGIRLGPEAAPAALGVSQAFSVADLDAQLPQLLENQASVWYPFATHDGMSAKVDGWLNKVRARVRLGVSCPSVQQDVCVLLDDMRLVKDAHELGIMRRASQISAGAHIRAMKRSASMLRAGQDSVNTTWTLSCFTNFANTALNTQLMAPLWPAVPMHVCCTTAQMLRLF